MEQVEQKHRYWGKPTLPNGLESQVFRAAVRPEVAAWFNSLSSLERGKVLEQAFQQNRDMVQSS